MLDHMKTILLVEMPAVDCRFDDRLLGLRHQSWTCIAKIRRTPSSRAKTYVPLRSLGRRGQHPTSPASNRRRENDVSDRR